MRLPHGMLFFLFATVTGLSAQQSPIVKHPLIGERDKTIEDEVAKSFETIRSDAKLPPLTRISHRSSLEQQVCTIAQAGDLGKFRSGDLVAFFRTVRPESGSALLTKVALFNKQDTKKSVLSYPRYSVAVWQVNDSKTGETAYWVGVERYWSALEEFVDYHFTDDVSYHNRWKEAWLLSAVASNRRSCCQYDLPFGTVIKT